MRGALIPSSRSTFSRSTVGSSRRWAIPGNWHFCSPAIAINTTATTRKKTTLSNASLRSVSLVDQQNHENSAAEVLRLDGAVLFSERFPDEFLEAARGLADEAFKDGINRGKLINEHRGQLTTDGSEVPLKNGIGIGQKAGFKELIQRAEGRFDITWRMNSVFETHHSGSDILSKIDSCAKSILGADAKLEFQGCLMSFPGGKEQLWHADGEHLFNEEELDEEGIAGMYSKKRLNTRNDGATGDFSADLEILPCHCLNFFIPLVNVQSQNGGTEFCLGSHMKTQKIKGSGIVWQNDAWKDMIYRREDGSIEEPRLARIQVQAGQILAFDYRVLHRALAHQESQPRPVLYLTYCKPWFSDSLNFSGLPSLKEADDDLTPDLLSSDSSAGSVGSNPISDSIAATVRSVAKIRNEQYPLICNKTPRVFADGAAGTQVPNVVIDAISNYLRTRGATNIGGNYSTSSDALKAVRKARLAGATLMLGYNQEYNKPTPIQLEYEETFTRRIQFGLNCTNCLFHLARSLMLTENGWFVPYPSSSKVNIVVSGACHDANVAPWLRIASELNQAPYLLSGRQGPFCEVRWIQTKGHSAEDREDNDALAVDRDEDISALIDENTRVVAIGLASNATGRVHVEQAQRISKRIKEVRDKICGKVLDGKGKYPLYVLDSTHFSPHRPLNIDSEEWNGAVDVAICSAYKLCGPHLGIMAFGKDSILASDDFGVWKIGYRSGDSTEQIRKSITDHGKSTTDLLYAGLPTEDGYEISRWEMGTLPYESLAGFSALMEKYYSKMVREAYPTKLPELSGSHPFMGIGEYEVDRLSRGFLNGFEELERKMQHEMQHESKPRLQLHGTRNPEQRTPTFAISVTKREGTKTEGKKTPTTADLCTWLNRRGETGEKPSIYCTHGNHYAPPLVADGLGLKDDANGVVRLSFVHYNTPGDVQKVLEALEEFWKDELLR